MTTFNFKLAPRTTHTNVLGFDGITWTHKPLEILLVHGRFMKCRLIFKIRMRYYNSFPERNKKANMTETAGLKTYQFVAEDVTFS